MEYYYFKNEKLFGPLPLEDLVKVITSKTLVKDYKNEWKLASEYPEITSKMELLNVFPEKTIIPPLPNKNQRIERQASNKINYKTSPPSLKKKNESLSSNDLDKKIVPPILSRDTKKNISSPPKIERKERVDETHKNKKRLANKYEYSSNGGLGFSWIFGLAVVVGLIALASMFLNNKSSNNGVYYNTSSSKKSNSHYKIQNKADETNESYNNSSGDESIEDELTEDFVNTVFTYKRTCKCCGTKFSPKTNISEFDDCSDKSATVESYEFCSGKCCRKYYNGYCE